VLVLRPKSRSGVLAPDQRRLVEAVLGQVAQTIERIRLADEASAANAAVQAETLRNSLLSAIAHDFRTPLASIVAASSTLLQAREQLSAGQVKELTSTILEQGERMAHLANNTLEMARLEGGSVTLRREWYPLDEIIGAAMTRMEERVRRHRAGARVLPGNSLAQVDIVMIVQVLENLIENAVKYTPAGTRLDIGAQADAAQSTFWVGDEGPGLPAGEEDRIFEKFYRAKHQQDQDGVGLGLTICRILVEAHGGRIVATNQAGGGALFRFSIPHTETPPETPPELTPEE
jgi:two-component system sensor histidine kinase KdpD